MALLYAHPMLAGDHFAKQVQETCPRLKRPPQGAGSNRLGS